MDMVTEALHWGGVAIDGNTLQVIASGLIFYATAMLVLVYFGLGMTLILVDSDLRAQSWVIAPFIGYAHLTIVSSWVVALGADMRLSILICFVLATLSASWAVARAKNTIRSVRLHPLLLLVTLTLTSTMVTIFCAMHNGSLAYVGPEFDLYLLIPLTEWLKSHSAPLFSFGTDWMLAPEWNASLPPTGDWLDPDAHLGSANHRSDDSNFLFQRGPRYFEAALGLVLGWDSHLIFRPAQAFMLSLVLPATYIFCSHLVRVSRLASVLTVALVGLNGTLFYWIASGHPGQAAGSFLLPMAIVLFAAALRKPSRMSCIAAAMAISAQMISYYQGVPLLLIEMAAVGIVVGIWCGTITRLATQSVAIGLASIVFTAPEQVRLWLVWINGAIARTSGLGDANFSPIGDGLGTTVHTAVYEMVVGRGQVSDTSLFILQTFQSVSTAAAVALLAIGLALGHGRGIAFLRAALLGSLALLACLKLMDYPYGYSKAQASCVFIFCLAIALGIERLWFRFVVIWRSRSSRQPMSLISMSLLSVFLALPVLSTTSSFALSTYAFWKPVGNIWATDSWQASALTERLATVNAVELSPNILADSESLWMLLYFLRNQRIEGHTTVQWMESRPIIVGGQARETAATPVSPVSVLGTKEIAGAKGFVPSDALWSGNLVTAYRSYRSIDGLMPEATATDGSRNALPIKLPCTLTITAGPSAPMQHEQEQANYYLLLTIASEEPATVQVEMRTGIETIAVDRGVTIRSIPIRIPSDVVLDCPDSAQISLVSASVRDENEAFGVAEYYPKAVVAAGTSSISGNTVTTRFTYLNTVIPASHSIDVYTATGDSHPGWFELPTNPDGQLKTVEVRIHGSTLECEVILNGEVHPSKSSRRHPGDGQYAAYFSTSYGAAKPSRVPLYTYSLRNSEVVSFQPYPFLIAWDGHEGRLGGN